MVIFRENTEDIYAGLEVEACTPEAKKLVDCVKERVRLEHPPRLGRRHQADHRAGSKRLIRAAATTRSTASRKSVTMVHKGNIHEVHRGCVPQLGLRARARGVQRRRRRLGRLRRQPRRQDPREGRHRRHHPAAGAHPSGRVRRDRDARTSTATTCPTRSPRRWAASASRRAATSTTSPATASSRRRTAPRRSTRARTR